MKNSNISTFAWSNCLVVAFTFFALVVIAIMVTEPRSEQEVKCLPENGLTQPQEND